MRRILPMSFTSRYGGTRIGGLSGNKLALAQRALSSTQQRQGWSYARGARKTKTPFNGDNRKNQRTFSGDGFVANSDIGAHGLFNIHGSLY